MYFQKRKGTKSEVSVALWLSMFDAPGMDDLSMKHCETTQSLGATLGTTMATLTQSALPVTWSVSERGKSRKERELDVLTEKVDMCEGEEKKEKKKQDEEEQETKADPKENRNEGNDEEEIAMYF